MRTEISGTVDGDVDIATQGLDITGTASIGGDVLYRSPGDADINASAQIDGTTTRLPTRGNFIYGVILSLATVISFLGFIVAGIVSIWLMRTSSSRAVGSVLRKPIRSFLAGIVTVLVFPALVIILAMTLVGLPLAAIGVLVGGIAFIVGPVPVVTALGNRAMLNRGGLFGGFVVGAVLWRLGIWIVPVVGGFIYLIALVWGIGAWVMGLAAARRGDPTPAVLLPASMIAKDETPSDWEPPLAPIRTQQPRAETHETPSPGDELGEELAPSPESGGVPGLGAIPADTEVSDTTPEGTDGTDDDPPNGTDSWGLPSH